MHALSVRSQDATSSCEDAAFADATISKPPGTELAAHIAGFVVGEGTFTSTKRAHTFAVMLAEVDALSCELLRSFFGVGSVYHYPRRKAHFDDFVLFQVRKTADLVQVIVPFMDEHLPPSFKRQQYTEWRARVMQFWDHDMKRRRPCKIEGCELLQKGRGVCRRHYYALYGK